MLIKKGFDWSRYIVNCREEELYDVLLKIINKGGIVLGWDICDELQALIKGEGVVDIWVEVIDNHCISPNDDIVLKG